MNPNPLDIDTFDNLLFLRAMERVKHAELTKELGALITALGYSQKTHRFVHAEVFYAATSIYPSMFLAYVQGLYDQVSSISEDHVMQEGLAVLNIILGASVPIFQRSPLQTHQALAAILRKIALDVRVDWEQEKGQPFSIVEQTGERFTLAQARKYLIDHAQSYHDLPGKDRIE